MHIKRLPVAAAAVALAGIGAAFVTAVPASAASSEYCTTEYACLYYNSNYQGAFYRQLLDIPNYQNYYFSTSAAGSNGAGLSVKNNAASLDNWDFQSRVRVYFNSNYAGVYQTIAAGGQANLNSSLKNENASGSFIDY